MADLDAYRRRLGEHRASLAGPAAESLVARLVELAPVRSDGTLEDDLCTRVGAPLLAWSNGPVEDHVGPNPFAEAIITAAAAAVGAALDQVESAPDDWLAPWRVMTTVARTVPVPLSAMAADAIADLRRTRTGRELPELPSGPVVTGEVLWIRDAYGSRFGVTAPISTAGGPTRWYLWDIDACGHQALTVHSAYYATPEQALAAWRAGVGPIAAPAAAFTAVDSRPLLADLLPAEEGFLQVGGENADQFAEYHRSKRLAEAVRDAVTPSGPAQPPDLDARHATTQFTEWLRARYPSRPQPDDLDELAEELADSWHIGGPAALYSTCSPHRVALTVLHIRNYYQDDFASCLIGMLTDWTTWLGERNGTPPELAHRCQPYALGKPHDDVGSDDTHPNYLARVPE